MKNSSIILIALILIILLLSAGFVIPALMSSSFMPFWAIIIAVILYNITMVFILRYLIKKI